MHCCKVHVFVRSSLHRPVALLVFCCLDKSSAPNYNLMPHVYTVSRSIFCINRKTDHNYNATVYIYIYIMYVHT